MIFKIVYDGNVIGSAKVIRKGLFYEISCFDTMQRPHRIAVSVCQRTVDLGLSVPDKDGYRCFTRIPVKLLGDGEMEFRAMGVQRFIPVFEDKPFSCLHRLCDARFTCSGEDVGVLIKEQSLDQ